VLTISISSQFRADFLRYPLYVCFVLLGLAFAIWAFYIGSQNYVMTEGNCQIFSIKFLVIATGVVDLVVFLCTLLCFITAAAYWLGRLDTGIFVLIGSAPVQNALLVVLRICSIGLLIAMSAMTWSTSCSSSAPLFYSRMNIYLIVYWCLFVLVDLVFIVSAVVLAILSTVRQVSLIKGEIEEEKHLRGNSKSIFSMNSVLNSSDADFELKELSIKTPKQEHEEKK
jgi:hypothetical protein